ncbi:MAG: carbohydrate-binding domain-containing protein [Coriobacteriales bacterium]|jgi:hypothetical protein|nr:carbohydrate-binding domain-containing protein [Coriobacteriales bacterium]
MGLKGNSGTRERRSLFATANLAQIVVLLALFALIVWVSSCSAFNPGTEQSPTSTQPGTQPDQSAPEPTGLNGDTAGVNNFDFSISDRDRDASYDASAATRISFSAQGAEVSGLGARAEGSTVTITAEGTYILSGECDAGGLVVALEGDEAKVQIVLDDLYLSNSDAPALLVEQADKVFLTLAEGSKNYLGDSLGRSDLAADGAATDASTTDAATSETSDSTTAATRDATLFSHDDLSINGSGLLEVASVANHGIVSKDDLVLTGGTISVQAGGDGVQGKDCVKLAGGSLKVQAGDDGIKSTETDEPSALGFVTVDGTIVNISCTDDALKGESLVRLASGSVTIDASTEGIEAPLIWVEGGTHSVVSRDDGLNAAGEARSDWAVDISGGTLFIDGSGDGLDSNGTLHQSGGTVLIAGPTRQGNGGVDAMSASTDGGTLLALDSSGMGMGFGTDSTQAALLFTLPGIQPAGTRISLAAADGNLLFSYTTPKQFNTLAFSSPELTQGRTYSFMIGGEVVAAGTVAEELGDFCTSGSLTGASLLCEFTLSEPVAAVAADGSVSAYNGTGMFGGGPQGRGGGGTFGPQGRGESPPEAGGTFGPQERQGGSPPEETSGFIGQGSEVALDA